MSNSSTPEITDLLVQWQNGERDVGETLMPLIYEELRKIAHRHMRKERPNQTMSTTSLVNEAFLNLVDQSKLRLENRLHFFAIASRVMRRVLIWNARKRNAAKRGGGQIVLPIEDIDIAAQGPIEDLIELDQAMNQLEKLDERLCRVVECRYFAGLSIDETAAILNISAATVKRDWQTAKAWLHKALKS